MSLDAEPVPSKLRSVERATRMTFSFGDDLTISTSLGMRPILELAISLAASGE